MWRLSSPIRFRRSWAQECRRSGAPRNLLTNAVVKPKIAAPSEPPGDQNRTPTSRNSLNSKRNLKGRLFQNSSSESELPIRFGREARGGAGGGSPPPADGGQKGLLLHDSRLTLALLSHYTRSALTGCFLAAQSCRRAGLSRKGTRLRRSGYQSHWRQNCHRVQLLSKLLMKKVSCPSDWGGSPFLLDF